MRRSPEPWVRPDAGREATPQRKCSTCGETFWTQVGLDEHLRRGDHRRVNRRWGAPRTPTIRSDVDPRFGNATRRRCCFCGKVSTPAGIALHHKYTGHAGWVEA
ncbi:MAG TPA: hypothetical protein VFJ14_10285 [Nocardioidaceae bacterium]|nr:hypothetical protein [Nocardioidaceae bacterium]